MKNNPLPCLHCPILETALQKVGKMLACSVCLMVEMVMAVAIRLPESCIWPHMALACSHPHVRHKERAGKVWPTVRSTPKNNPHTYGVPHLRQHDSL